VAISGFTEGIGWAFVQLLLKLNVKLILIGRNK
jgi:short-subunit dehydrogenase